MKTISRQRHEIKLSEKAKRQRKSVSVCAVFVCEEYNAYICIHLC